MKTCFSIVILVFVVAPQIEALDNNLTNTPPMGWVSWERFRCNTDCVSYPEECISERLIRKQADLMVSEGYLEAGYKYIIIGGCWAEKERENDNLVAVPERFPRGIKKLAAYVHGKGLKLGIQSSFKNGENISLLEIDAKTFARWGIDFLKLESDTDEAYKKMAGYLNATGRPIVHSCKWSIAQDRHSNSPNYAGNNTEHCNLFRNFHDIDDSWNSVTDILKLYKDNQDKIATLAGPGHWNDPDSLIIDNFGLSIEQCKAQMVLWAILAAPLIMSNNLARIHPRYKAILLNKDVIAINQDILGIQGQYVTTIDNIDIWVKPILPKIHENCTHAIAFLSNRVDGYKHRIVFKMSQLKLENPLGYVIENMFDKTATSLVRKNSTFAVHVKPTGVVLLRARPVCEDVELPKQL